MLRALCALGAALAVAAQDRCAYMTSIPREPRPPDLPPIQYEGLAWDERPLLPAAERDDVCMDAYFPVGAGDGVQLIYVDEERDGDVAIARLNYRGDGAPSIDPGFGAGSFHNLGPELRAEAGAWLLYTTVRQDYEAGMTRYAFTVRVPGHAVAVTVNLQIVNIDDNRPMLDIYRACSVPELGEARLTECVYEVHDADGRLSTSQMTFRVDSEAAAELFYLQGSVLPSTWFTMLVTVGTRAPLDFEQRPLHIFSVTAADSLPNEDTATLMVQVENVEHRPPRWVEIFAVQQFDEKTEQAFPLRAIDGDTGIDKPIYYRLETDPADTFFSVESAEGGRGGGVLRVAPIDRDALQREVFRLGVVAYKRDNASLSAAAPLVVIVNDVNDNAPEPLHAAYRVAVPEETAVTLDLHEFGFHDIDLGENAQYAVRLEAVSPPGAEAAFYIAPAVGYQRQEFVVGTADHSLLDYDEEPPFERVVLRVVATDTNDTRLERAALLHVELVNWNDERPVFEPAALSVAFNETEGAGFHVGRLRATDRDVGDRVEHSLLGSAADFLRIEPASGDVYVAADHYFDFHRQSVHHVQVRAVDTLGAPFHSASAALTIRLLDVNNTPPSLRLPRGRPRVHENEPAGFRLTDAASALAASDPDTTARLRFSIDWAASYATKQGRDADPAEFHGCVEIVTEYPEPGRLGAAAGHLEVREIRHNVTVDFEMFEVLYLAVTVRDLNTDVGEDSDSATLAVEIVDLNDNPPLWEPATLDQSFTVREMADSGVVVGSILATDIDGPLYNRVRYSISPRGDTPPDLVEIDPLSGQMRVLTGQAIDADTPPRHLLLYSVAASDRCAEPAPAACPPDPTHHDTLGEIAIFITDMNNKAPEPEYGSFDSTVYIYENATSGDDVTYVVARDRDRDEIYHTVRYQINYAVNARLLDFFKVELDSGRVYVEYPGPDVLDRDGDEPQHRIFFTLVDNLYGEGDGNRNQNTTEILVVLLDVNDNAPELPAPSELAWSVSEDLAAGEALRPEIHAPDRDEPGTPNSLVGFAVPALSAADRDLDPPALFRARSLDTDRAELVTTAPLRGYWGTYTIHIHAFDHGQPQQHAREQYSLRVRPYNYHAPAIEFPAPGALLRLARERALAGSVPVTLQHELPRPLAATDPDGLHAGTVSFAVVGDDEAVEYFDVSTNGAERNQATLVLKRTVTETREFHVAVRATDGGTEPGARWADSWLRAVFVPSAGDPEFAAASAELAFVELEAGLAERHALPLAEDPKNYLCSDDCHAVYYSIVDGNGGGEFVLDAQRNVLALARPLLRADGERRSLVVAAANSPAGGAPLPASLLRVTVTVREADPRPVFDRELYSAGISTLDSINKELLTVRATHSELAALEYVLDEQSMQADPSLAAVQDAAFRLEPASGVLSLAMQPTASMQGAFDFRVLALAPDGGSATALVRIYLVTSENRVTFLFINTLEKVEQSAEFIADTLSAGFGMRCHVEQVVPAADAQGLARADRTELRAHFVRDQRPVPAAEIDRLRSDLELLTEVSNALRSELLLLSDLYTGELAAPAAAAQGPLYALAALAALLAVLCAALLLACRFRTRALNRRLEALSTTKYGSAASGLNRLGLAAPGTNKHAAEGSNPVWNEAIRAPDFDAVSDASDDSDLVGVEELPQFRAAARPPLATHDNRWGTPTASSS